LPHGIELLQPAGPGPVLSVEAWRRFVEDFQRADWQLAQTEFRHNRFDTDDAGQPRQSQFYFSAHLINPSRSERAILEGDLVVDWASKRPDEEMVPVKRIDASALTIKTRQGEPAFRLVQSEQITPPSARGSVGVQASAWKPGMAGDGKLKLEPQQNRAPKPIPIDPLILYDLDGDGPSEIILPTVNLVYQRSRRGNEADAQENPPPHFGGYEPQQLCKYSPGLIQAAVVADFDGDGAADLLCAKVEGLVLFKGSPQGAFDQPGRLVWTASPLMTNAMVLTCGDIDRDGDLDVFLGQYKVPSLGQILRPHYYDANDGYPAYLLLNDGHGSFTDATVAAGLEKKRGRRIFCASFDDLNGDGLMHLVVVSDFAGLDLYRNDGHGHFTDVTRDWVAEPQAFGMGHAVADFNADGRLDLLMIGMNSPTVDRLEHLGLARPINDSPSPPKAPLTQSVEVRRGWGVRAILLPTEDSAMRRRMTFGNRLFLARAEGGFAQTAMNDSIARTGWSWGCSAFDFDNDGFPDVYIANGHESKQTVRDYESEFWLHDIYVDDSVDDFTATTYFTSKYARTRGSGWSYGGYEKKRLYLNRRGESFVEIGHLMGVALQEDSRCAVADDLDGDGRVDLLLTTYEIWPEEKQTLRIYKNTLDDSGNWIGFRFREEPGQSPVGAQVTIHFAGHTEVRQIVTGDGFRSQHANTLHFGLGKAERVDSAEIQWPSGRLMTLNEPAINRYHSISPKAENTFHP
jgi:hypothetical protein